MITFMRWLNQNPQESKNPSSKVTGRLRTLMKGYRSTMDAPCCDLVPELLAAYPNAKFILSVRDSEDSWWRSWYEALGDHFGSGLRRNIYRGCISSVSLLRRMDDMAQETRYRLVRDWGSIGPHIYGMHNQRVRDLVPKGQLLEFNVKEGWGPLCTFLEVDVPEKPFPKLNEGGSMKAIYFGQQIFGAAAWAFYLGVVVGATYLAAKPQLARSFLQSAQRWVKSTLR